MKKAGYGENSLKWAIWGALTLVTLPLHVLSKTLSQGDIVNILGNHSNYTVENKNISKKFNESSINNYWAHRLYETHHNKHIPLLLSELSSFKENFTSEVEKNTERLGGLNQTFYNIMSSLMQNINDTNQILTQSTNALRDDSSVATGFFQNAPAIFAHFNRLAGRYIQEQKAKESLDIGMTAANLVLTGAMIISVYIAYRKISNRLDNINIESARLIQNNV